MLRRVAWMGPGKKKRGGDCIVINFNNSSAAGYIVDNFFCPNVTERSILPYELSYFYSPIRSALHESFPAKIICFRQKRSTLLRPTTDLRLFLILTRLID